MKRKLTGLLAAVLTAGMLTVPVQAKSVDEYPDVHQGDWYYEYVKDVTDKSLMTGYDDGRFGAVDALGRGQFATVLYRMEGSPETSYASIYPDAPDGWFYSVPVTWANQARVITGYEDGRFGPADKITREQVATIMFRYAQLQGKDTSVRGDYSSFPDGYKVSGFASEAMQWAIGEGIIKGNDNGTLAPQGNVSRAVCATIISRYISAVDEEESYTYEIQVMNNPDYTLYNKISVVLYIKTDNPDPNSFFIDIAEDETDTVVAAEFNDVHYETEEPVGNNMRKVPGGYLYVIQSDTPGTKTLNILEGDSNAIWTGSGKQMYNTQITLQDYDRAQDQWFSDVISQVTDQSMTGKEKLDALCSYVFNNFNYIPESEEGYALTLVNHTGAFWEIKEIECWTATDIMQEFARRLGYESEATYAGYLSHYYATVTIDGEQYPYDACPMADNILTSWDYVL